MQVAGRWHRRGDEVIYASEHYSTALLEKLVYCNGVLPPNQHFVEIAIPGRRELRSRDQGLRPETGPDANSVSARTFGTRWYRELRSAILFVPSVVARMERNIVINAKHADFPRINVGLEAPVSWDQRLFISRPS